MYIYSMYIYIYIYSIYIYSLFYNDMSAGFCGSKAELDILSSSQDTVLETVQAKTCSFVKE